MLWKPPRGAKVAGRVPTRGLSMMLISGRATARRSPQPSLLDISRVYRRTRTFRGRPKPHHVFFIFQAYLGNSGETARGEFRGEGLGNAYHAAHKGIFGGGGSVSALAREGTVPTVFPLRISCRCFFISQPAKEWDFAWKGTGGWGTCFAKAQPLLGQTTVLGVLRDPFLFSSSLA